MSTLPRRGWRLSTSQADSRHLSVRVTASYFWAWVWISCVGIARDVRVTAEKSADLRSCLREKAILYSSTGTENKGMCPVDSSRKIKALPHSHTPRM